MTKTNKFSTKLQYTYKDRTQTIFSCHTHYIHILQAVCPKVILSKHYSMISSHTGWLLLLVIRCCRWSSARLPCYVCRQVFEQFVFFRFTCKAEIIDFALELDEQVCQVIVELQPATIGIHG